ncbi:hypothetical protein QDY65_00915 [Pyrococcus kukulkanii]|uniref:hypothetical protein n=1 Tax=Pyrococcus kukulkanii TaxID=1609559 RepID=UPI00356B33CB
MRDIIVVALVFTILLSSNIVAGYKVVCPKEVDIGKDIVCTIQGEGKIERFELIRINEVPVRYIPIFLKKENKEVLASIIGERDIKLEPPLLVEISPNNLIYSYASSTVFEGYKWAFYNKNFRLTFRINNETASVNIIIKGSVEPYLKEAIVIILVVGLIYGLIVLIGTIKGNNKGDKHLTGRYNRLQYFSSIIGYIWLSFPFSAFLFYLMGTPGREDEDFALSISIVLLLVSIFNLYPNKKELKKRKLAEITGIEWLPASLFLPSLILESTPLFMISLLGFILAYILDKLESINREVAIGGIISTLAWPFILYAMFPGDPPIFLLLVLVAFYYALLLSEVNSRNEIELSFENLTEDLIANIQDSSRSSVLGPPPTAQELIEIFDKIIKEMRLDEENWSSNYNFNTPDGINSRFRRRI